MKRALPCVFWFADDDRPQDLGALFPALPRGSGLILRSRGALAPLKHKVHAARPWRYQHSVFVTGRPDYRAEGLHIREGERPGPALPRLKKRFFITVLCHSLPSLIRQNKRAVHGIFVSPIFPTNSHPGAKPLGLYTLRKMMRVSQKPLIALGGVNAKTGRLLPRGMGWGSVFGDQNCLRVDHGPLM